MPVALQGVAKNQVEPFQSVLELEHRITRGIYLGKIGYADFPQKSA